MLLKKKKICLEQNDTYPKVLEKMLKEYSYRPRFEVINAGKKGYNTSQELTLLKTVGLGLNPETVILGYYYNDTEADSQQLPVFAKEPEIMKKLDRILCANSLRSNSLIISRKI